MAAMRPVRLTRCLRQRQTTASSSDSSSRLRAPARVLAARPALSTTRATGVIAMRTMAAGLVVQSRLLSVSC